MPTVATNYRADFPIPEEASKSLGVVLSCPVQGSDRTIVEADSGTFELLDTAGNVVATGAVTTSATYTATYDLTPTALDDLGYSYRYRVRWTLVIGGDTYVWTNTLGVVRQAFINPVVDQDLLDLHGELLTLIQGTGKTDLSTWTQTAYEWCVRWMVRQANRPASVLDSTQLKELVTLWALEFLFRDLATGRRESHYSEESQDYAERRKELQGQIAFEYDLDMDGANDADQRAGTSVTFLSANGWR